MFSKAIQVWILYIVHTATAVTFGVYLYDIYGNNQVGSLVVQPQPIRCDNLGSKFIFRFGKTVSDAMPGDFCFFRQNKFFSDARWVIYQKWWSSCFLRDLNFHGQCNIPPKEAGISYIQVSAGMSTPCFSEVMVKLLPAAQDLMDTAAFRFTRCFSEVMVSAHTWRQILRGCARIATLENLPATII